MCVFSEWIRIKNSNDIYKKKTKSGEWLSFRVRIKYQTKSEEWLSFKVGINIMISFMSLLVRNTSLTWWNVIWHFNFILTYIYKLKKCFVTKCSFLAIFDKHIEASF